MSEKVFLLGMGAMKSGTSWLWSSVKNAPNVDFGSRKEYHVLDTLYLDYPPYKRRARDLINRVKDQYSQRNYSLNNQTQRDSRLISFCENINNYYDYFQFLVLRGAQITGDFTPSYALLPANILKSLKYNFKKRGINVKVVYMLRDPVSRAISHFWHGVNRETINRDEYIQGDAFNSKIIDFVSTQDVYLKSSYQNTIRVIDSVFKASNVHYCFYEKMLKGLESDKLTSFFEFAKFAGINGISSPNFSRKPASHVDSSVNLHVPILKQCCEVYRETYDFCRDRFDQLPSAWNG